MVQFTGTCLPFMGQLASFWLQHSLAVDFAHSLAKQWPPSTPVKDLWFICPFAWHFYWAWLPVDFQQSMTACQRRDYKLLLSSLKLGSLNHPFHLHVPLVGLRLNSPHTHTAQHFIGPMTKPWGISGWFHTIRSCLTKSRLQLSRGCGDSVVMDLG